MADVFSETTSTGWGGRIKSSIGGILIGLVMFVGAFPVQWWNEGRAVKQTLSLEEGASAVVAASIDKVDPAHQGKLVHLSGTVEAPGELADEEFGISLKALGLRRKVEMYQWREKKDSKEKKKLGGGTETVTEYRYEKGWDDDAIDSDSFRHPEDHRNPGEFPLQSNERTADSAQLGAYELDARMVGELEDWRSLKAPADASTSIDDFERKGDGFYRGANPQSPQVGDVRVNFQYIPEGPFSFVAKQEGNGLVEYPTKAGNPILLVETGSLPAADMFKHAHAANTIMTWVFRGIGFALMWIGLGLIMRPLSVLADVIPLVGTIVGKGTGLIAFLLALVFSLLTVALAWVFYRPLLGISLLVLMIGAVVMMRRKGSGKVAAAAGAAPPPPPAMSPPPPPRA